MVSGRRALLRDARAIARCRCGRRFLAAKGAWRAAPHRTRALGRRRARHRARRRAQGAGRDAHPDYVHNRDQHGLDRRRRLRGRKIAGGHREDGGRHQLGRNLPRQPATGGNRVTPQAGRLQDAVRTGVRGEERRSRAAEGDHRRGLDRGVPAGSGRAGDGHRRLQQAAGPVPRGGDGHRDGRGRRAEPRQRRRGDARQHVRAWCDRAGVDGRPAAGRRHDRQQPADRSGTKALRRRGDRRQHRNAPAEARRDHLRACRGEPDDGLPRQADGRRAAEEHGTERRADRARPRRHFGGQVRPREGRDSHRRGGHAEDGGVAVALQHPARPVRGAPRETGPWERRAGNSGRDPFRGSEAHQSRSAGRARGDQARRAYRSRRRSAPTCAASTAAATSRASMPRLSGPRAGHARW